MPIERWSDTIWLVKLSDEPAMSDDLLGTAEEASRSAKSPDVVIDMTWATHMNSSNVSQLLRLRKVVQSGDGRLRLVGMRQSIRSVLETMEIDKLFHFVTDVPTALAGLQIDE